MPELYSYLCGKLCSLFIGAEQHINYKCKCRNREDKTQNVYIAGEETAELIYHKSYEVSESALIADCKPGPLPAVHFTLDSADSRKAGCAKQVEHKERIRGDSGERSSDIVVNACVSAAVKYTESTDNVFFCNKTGNGSHNRFPVAPAERFEYPGDSAADFSKDRRAYLIFL